MDQDSALELFSDEFLDGNENTWFCKKKDTLEIKMVVSCVLLLQRKLVQFFR